MDSNKAVTATFGLVSTLSVTKDGLGSGSVSSNPPGITCGADCSEVYANGTQVTLTAVPASDSLFAGWGGACGGIGACVVTMDAARTVTATFNVPRPPLTVMKGGTGSGSVISNPPGIACGADCTESYANGAQVTLTAMPAADSVFAGWAGACSGTGSCQVTMDAPRSVTALFQLITVGVNVVRQPGGPALIVTLSARQGCGAIDHVQFGIPGRSFDNALVSITSQAGAPSGQTAGFSYTPPPGTTSISLAIRRVVDSGSATVAPIHFFDGCGDWPTFVGGGPDAYR
jgi:hypothetical protein